MWIEMRCENRFEESSNGNFQSHCWSHDNAGPMGEASDTKKSILDTVRGLEQEGREAGWSKKRAGWFCPFCSRLPEVKP